MAAASVTSPHTIHKGITRAALRELAASLTDDQDVVLGLLSG